MICIVQARASSKRVKKKIFEFVNNKSILQHAIDNIKACNSISKIIVATSNQQDDDETENLCKKLNVISFRGDLNDVASRFYKIIKKYNADFFLRINADSPLIDPNLISYFIDHYKKGNNDIITNVLERTYPKGQSIEIFNSNAFLEGYEKLNTNDEKEHVTTFFYNNSDKYKILNIKNDVSYSEVNLSVDTDQDLKKIRKIYKLTKNRDWLSYAKKYKQIYK